MWAASHRRRRGATSCGRRVRSSGRVRHRARPGLAAAVVHRQGVHVGANGDGVSGALAFDHGDDAALDEVRVDSGDAALPVVVANQVHRAFGLEPEFGVRVDVAADLLEFGHELGNAGQQPVFKKQGHLGSPYEKWSWRLPIVRRPEDGAHGRRTCARPADLRLRAFAERSCG